MSNDAIDTSPTKPEGATAQPLSRTAGSTFSWGGDEYPLIAHLGDGWALIAHPNGPAISNGDTISTLDIYEGETLAPRLVKIRAHRAFTAWAWPRLKPTINFPDGHWSNMEMSNAG